MSSTGGSYQSERAEKREGGPPLSLIWGVSCTEFHRIEGVAHMVGESTGVVPTASVPAGLIHISPDAPSAVLSHSA